MFNIRLLKHKILSVVVGLSMGILLSVGIIAWQLYENHLITAAQGVAITITGDLQVNGSFDANSLCIAGGTCKNSW